MTSTAEPASAGGLARWWVYAQAVGAVLPLAALAVAPGCVASDHFEFVLSARPLFWIAVALPLVLWLEIRCALIAVGLIRFYGNASAWLEWYGSEAAKTARRRRRMKIVAAAGSFLLGLGAAEAMFRVLNLHDPHHVPKGVVFADYDVRLNALGLRETWDMPPPRDRRTRIAVLGDSMVFGLGVPPEQTFAKLLENELHDIPGGVVTFNVGAPGTAPHVQREKLEDLLPVLQPDLVVQVLYPNDLGVELRSLVQRIHDIRREPFWTGRGSYLLHFIELKIREAVLWRQTLAFYRGGLTAAERALAWQRFEKDLTACRDTFRAAGAGYVIVLFPWLIELHDYPLIDVHERVGHLINGLGVEYLDLLPAFAGRNAALYRNSDVDEHPNARGHETAARAIGAFLRDSVLGD